MKNERIPEIEQLLGREIDDLWVTLAEATMQGVGPMDNERKRRLGRAWFEAQFAELRDELCIDPRIVALRSSGAPEVEVAAAIADVVLAARGGLPATTMAVLIVKLGLSKLCD